MLLRPAELRPVISSSQQKPIYIVRRPTDSRASPAQHRNSPYLASLSFKARCALFPRFKGSPASFLLRRADLPSTGTCFLTTRKRSPVTNARFRRLFAARCKRSVICRRLAEATRFSPRPRLHSGTFVADFQAEETAESVNRSVLCRSKMKE